jgi:thiamine biosynthesis protein ThiI
MMRRGAEVIGLHFSGAPETPDSSSYLVQQIAQTLAPAGGLKQLVFVHFGSYQRQIALAVPERLRIIFYRRLMFATANLVAKELGAKALVTGESLGQVASQTLDNIVAVDCIAELPVLRPLIGTDKQEIINMAEVLHTFEISTQSTDDCCTLFMPRSPETHANLEEVNKIWNSLPVSEWLTEILLNKTIEGLPL